MVDSIQIGGRSFSPELLARIGLDVATRPELSRTQLAREVCEALDWRGHDGELKITSCRIALSDAEQRGRLTLPTAKGRFAPRKPVVAQEPELTLRCSLDALGELTAVVVNSSNKELNTKWNQLMAHHYLGPGVLVGRQIRYLFRSQRGVVGAAAFSAAAWAGAARDAWIGWSPRARRANLQYVVANSRFFIPEWIRVPNLASKLLAICTQQLRSDWPDLYGYTPVLLESYVEHERFPGSSYKAANWQHAGQTSGRGRQDRNWQSTLAKKDVYVFPLDPDWKTMLCQEPGPRPRRLANPRDWAEEELGGAELGDARLGARLIELARTFAAKPMASIPQACTGDPKRVQAAYRFMANKNVKLDKILQPHLEATVRRISEQEVVLAVQDTTFFNYTSHPDLDGAGPIGTSKENTATGFLMHGTMAYTDQGIPLGLVDVKVWARDPKQHGKKHQRRDLPIEQKESAKWLRSYRAAAAIQQLCPKTQVVSVGDREADVYELFSLARRRDSHPELLIRAEQNRRVNEEQPHLWEHLAKQPLAYERTIEVERTKNNKARLATLELRYASVELRPPKSQKLRNVALWAVWVKEVNPADGVTPLEWMLLTTIEVDSIERALQMVDWYRKRWSIETYHKILKSGCGIEDRRLSTVPRLENCLALDLVVAWRVQHLTMLGREVPDLPCTVFFEDHEWKALYAFLAKDARAVPAEPPTLREATRAVAKLGGFLGRKGDKDPGVEAIWVGLQRLDDISMSWLAFVERLGPHQAPLNDAQRLLYDHFQEETDA